MFSEMFPFVEIGTLETEHWILDTRQNVLTHGYTRLYHCTLYNVRERGKKAQNCLRTFQRTSDSPPQLLQPLNEKVGVLCCSFCPFMGFHACGVKKHFLFCQPLQIGPKNSTFIQIKLVKKRIYGQK